MDFNVMLNTSKAKNTNACMSSTLDAYLLSKCTLSLTSNGREISNRNDVKERSALSNEDLRPLKSGEILRDKMGIFSFLCTYCDVVCGNCNEIMDHINLHFDKENSFTHEAIDEPLPEFISIDEFEPETTTLEAKIIPNDVLQKLTNSMCQPNVSSILKSKVEMTITDDFGSNDGSDIECTSDKSKLTKIVRIVKLKPIKVRPRQVNTVEKTKMLCKVDQTNCSTKPADVQKINSPPEEMKYKRSQSEVKSVVSPAAHELVLRSSKENHTDENQSEKKKPAYVRLKHSRCYQCEMETKIYNPSVPKRHICFLCVTWFEDHMELETHCNEVHNKDANYIESNNFYCFVCEKKFALRNNLVSHLKVHNLNLEHLCPTCGLRFKSTTSLKEHTKTHEDRTFECDECGKKFKRFERLRNHFWCHNKDLSFVCKICSKAFKSKRYLKRHMAIHNGAKINCRYCDATFNFSSVRRAHEKTRHNVL